MIERQFVREKLRNFKIREHIETKINRYAGIGDVHIEKTPLGEKVIIFASRPGLVIGSSGETVKELTESLRTVFKLETPQIEIKEITNPSTWAAVVAKRIASDFERFGPARYKASGYKSLLSIMRTGARGAEIRITGVGIPGERAKSWRFNAGHLKKSGDACETVLDKSFEVAHLKRGAIGIKVAIMPAGARLPDDIIIKPIKIEEVPAAKAEVHEIIQAVEEAPKAAPKKPRAKKAKPTEAKKE